MMKIVLPLIVLVLLASCGTDASRRQNGIWSTSVGTGPGTVIVIHGGPGATHRYLRPEWDRLADSARVVYYDQRGCGNSERTDSVTWQQHVRDLENLVELARRDGPVFLAGSSWGSILAVLYAHENPDRVEALILSGVPDLKQLHFSSPTMRRGEPTVRYLAGGDSVVAYGDSLIRYSGDSVVLVAVLGDVSTTFRPVDSASAVLDSSQVAEDTMLHPIIAARMGMSCPGVRAVTWSSLRASGPSLDDLANVGLPVLIIHGTEHSPVGDGSRELAEFLAGATVVSLDGTGHDPWIDRPVVFFDLARRFLSGQNDEQAIPNTRLELTR